MSQEKVKGEIVFTCDNCEDIFETQEQDFRTAVSSLKGEGWKIVKNDETNQWEHYCPDCAEVL